MTVERSLTTREVADALSCDTETVLRYAQKGELRSWRLGNDRRYRESDVETFIRSRMDGVRGATIVPLRDLQREVTR